MCYISPSSSSSDVSSLPSLHQERVSPHLRLLVHLKPEEEDENSENQNSCTSAIFNPQPTLSHLRLSSPHLTFFFFHVDSLSTTAFTETASERAAKCASLLHFTPLNFGLELLSRPRQEQRVHFSSNHRTLHTFIPSLSARLHLVSILGCL